jgi:hypothetical protein
MAWLSNVGSSFDSGDWHESLVGIVALFGQAHNQMTYGVTIPHGASANQIPPGDTES